MVMISRDHNGYPLNEDGSIDWQKTSEEKTAMVEKWDRKAKNKKRNRMTHLTPKKKKRK